MSNCDYCFPRRLRAFIMPSLAGKRISRKRLVKWEVPKSLHESNQLRLSLFMTLVHTRRDPPSVEFGVTLLFDVTASTHTHIYPLLSVTSASLCCSCHSLFTLRTLNLLLDWLCSLGPSVPPHSHMHAHINTDTIYTHTHRDTQASCLLHGPC